MNTSVTEASSSHPEKPNFPTSRELISAGELTTHIQQCVFNDRHSQKKIYTTFFEFAMVICKRYTMNEEEAVEIINDGFLKVFKEIHRFVPTYSDIVSSFKGWVRRIMMYTAIDHFRRNKKHRFNTRIDDGIIQVSSDSENAIDRLSYRDILTSIQKLTPVYRAVLRLFIIEGLTHPEISKQLGISIGTSKSNLAKARVQLQKILLKQNQFKIKNQFDELYPET
jgi:RNA polymerase sigma-70 factor, ECF subfamily